MPPPSNSPIQERFFLTELARFLRCRQEDLKKLLRREGLLRELYVRHRGYHAFTTKRGVQLAIAHFRARQGAALEAGVDLIAETTRVRALMAKRRARLRAERDRAPG